VPRSSTDGEPHALIARTASVSVHPYVGAQLIADSSRKAQEAIRYRRVSGHDRLTPTVENVVPAE
jgi:hypothetical protein